MKHPIMRSLSFAVLVTALGVGSYTSTHAQELDRTVLPIPEPKQLIFEDLEVPSARRP